MVAPPGPEDSPAEAEAVLAPVGRQRDGRSCEHRWRTAARNWPGRTQNRAICATGVCSCRAMSLVALLDEVAAAGGRGDHLLGQALNKLAFLHGVDFDGQMTVRLGEEQLSQWRTQLEAAARSVVGTGGPWSVTWSGEVITVLPMGSAAGASFIGPAAHERGWERTTQRATGPSWPGTPGTRRGSRHCAAAPARSWKQGGRSAGRSPARRSRAPARSRSPHAR
jgi:hypothetical protein